MANKEFNDWLTSETKRRGWSFRELGRRAGKNASQALISLVLKGERSITWEFCAAIADAFDYSPIEVFEKANLLPGNGSDLTSKIADLSKRLSEERQEDLLEYAKFLMTKREAA